MGVYKRQPRASTPMTQKPRLDILGFKVAFKEDVILEKDHRRSDVVRHPPKLLNRILFLVGEGIHDVEGDFEVEYRIRKLRPSRRRIWTVEDFGWHVDIDVVSGEVGVLAEYISRDHLDSYPRCCSPGCMNRNFVTADVIEEHLHSPRSPARRTRLT